MRRIVGVVVVAVQTLGCGRNDTAAAGRDAELSDAAKVPEKSGSRHVELIDAPALGEVTEIVAKEVERAKNDGRDLVVYVGAQWCEPCTRFHDAAARGELDGAFPNLRLLTFDLDRDGERLARAGCRSKMVPLLALPKPDGSCGSSRMQGSVKGEGAVADMKPRLAELLSSR